MELDVGSSLDHLVKRPASHLQISRESDKDRKSNIRCPFTKSLSTFCFLTVDNNTNSSSASNATRLVVELPSIGYGGTWEQFCDPREMEKDHGAYSKHELQELRTLLCDLHGAGKMDREVLPILALYKYCVGVRFLKLR